MKTWRQELARYARDTKSKCELEPYQAAEILQRVEELESDAKLAMQFERALQSIAANTCCDKCQEAALVARAALLP